MNEVIADYWAGSKIRDIAKSHSIPERKVRQVLVQAGGRLKGASLDVDAVQRAELLAQDGYSQNAIAEATGLPVDQVYAWFPEAAWAKGGSKEGSVIREVNMALNGRRRDGSVK